MTFGRVIIRNVKLRAFGNIIYEVIVKDILDLLAVDMRTFPMVGAKDVIVPVDLFFKLSCYNLTTWYPNESGVECRLGSP